MIPFLPPDSSRCPRYILDTSTVGPTFPQRFAQLAEHFAQSATETSRAELAELLVPPAPASNVCVFGHGLVERYRRTERCRRCKSYVAFHCTTVFLFLVLHGCAQYVQVRTWCYPLNTPAPTDCLVQIPGLLILILIRICGIHLDLSYYIPVTVDDDG